jgi:hypothetical protein
VLAAQVSSLCENIFTCTLQYIFGRHVLYLNTIYINNTLFTDLVIVLRDHGLSITFKHLGWYKDKFMKFRWAKETF